MRLVIPHTGELQAEDARLVRLAEFLGIDCERVFFAKHDHGSAEYLPKTLSEPGSCLLVNPRVFKQWTGGEVSADLVAGLTSRFPNILVHALGAQDSFDERLIRALSGNRLHSVRPVDDAKLYEIPANSRDVCGAFSGLSFGPVNRANDLVLAVDAKADVRTLVSVGGSPFVALIKHDGAQLVFLASADVLDVDEEISDRPLNEYFSRLVPQAMALRYIFGEHCWRPSASCASFIIDDPLLRPRYGYLDYASLLNLMEEHNFSTTIAFIPHNYRRNSTSTIEMFRQRSGRLGICFHGNDHTAGEFASADSSQLNTMLQTAERRMDSHSSATGLYCPRIMVFPQDDFSVEAMKVLKSRNFCAAVCGTPHPAGHRVKLTIREQAQPAILRHANFPLFFRRSIGRIKAEDIALNVLFGQPVLVSEHHGLFQHVKRLLEDVQMINSIAPDIQWCDLETALLKSTLSRRTPDLVNHVRAYSRVVPIANNSDSPGRFLVEWSHSTECPPIERVLQGGMPIDSFTVDEGTIRVSVELPHRT
ncbi:MAG TPA: hypothetical protein VE641_19310, partial [Chthoniobacterales bacterium]|nr:hypothetical protein [Chthoniobacterales bacterium]